MPAPKDPVKREEWIVKLRAAKKRNRADPNSSYNKLEYREKQRTTHQTSEYQEKVCGDNNSSKRPEVREKMRKAKEGKPQSEEHVRKVQESKKRNAEKRGYWHSPESIEKMKKPKPKGFGEKMRKILEGKPKSEEAKQHMRKPHPSIQGEKNPAKRPEVRAKLSGKNNHNWRGGPASGDYPLAFGKKLKQFIRNRDKVCQLCGKTKEEEGKNLDVHHINYDKDDLFELNLITLCHSCNSKVNSKRGFWEDYFNYNILVGYKG